jgi:hypothetical protein
MIRQTLKSNRISAGLLVYSAAAFGLISSIIRDALLFELDFDATRFFSIVYFVSIPVGLVVNFITLGPEIRWSRLYTTTLVLYALVIGIASIVLFEGDFLLGFFSFLTAVCWVVGSWFSRRTFVNGRLFLGRIREGFGWLALSGTLFAVSGISPEAAVAFAAIFSFLFSWALYSLTAISVEDSNDAHLRSSARYVIDLFLLSLVGILINVWALWITGLEVKYFADSWPFMVRLSIYIFQVISIGYVLVVSKTIEFDRFSNRQLKAYATISLAVFLVSLSVPVMSLVITPVTLGFFGLIIVVLVGRNDFGDSNQM